MNTENGGLPLIAHCSSCAHAYQTQDAHLLEKRGKLSIYYLFCSFCEHALLLSVQHREDGMACTGIYTDCSFEDAKRFLHAERVSVDDVLRIHAALKLDKFLQIR